MTDPTRPEPLMTIRGVEIFRTGKWNGDEYDTADLDAMVEAFDQVGYAPPVKLGHDMPPGSRAYGWISGLRRVGDKLVADIKDLPASLYRLIKERAFDHVSAEIFWNLERGGRTFRRALKAVALLGAENPGVSDLAPLRSVVNSQPRGDAHVYTLSTRDLQEATMPQPQPHADAGEELVRRARDYQIAHPGARLDFVQALEAVMQVGDGPQLKERWHSEAFGRRNGAPPVSRNYSQGATARPGPVQRRGISEQQLDAEIERRVRLHMQLNPAATRLAALDAVTKADPIVGGVYREMAAARRTSGGQ